MNFYWLVLSVSVVKCSIALNESNSNKFLIDAENYLLNYGYLDKINNQDNESFVKGLLSFQKFTGLEETGVLDLETSSKMNHPRYCQNFDEITQFIYRGRTRIIYYAINFRKKISLNKSEIKEEIQRAASLWSSYVNIEFVSQHSAIPLINIEIGDNFECACDTALGHIELCGICNVGGRINSISIKISDTVHWSKSDFFATILHHFGHVLGLGHSNDPTSIMHPYVRQRTQHFLTNGDINAFQKSIEVKKAITDITVLCEDPKFDTVFTIPNGTIYIFKGDKYWVHDGNKVFEGPKSICEGWRGLPCLKIDAAYTYTDGKTYFFKNKTTWTFEPNKNSAEPEAMSVKYNGIPTNLDTATPWSQNGRIFFFRGDKYWGYDPYAVQKVHPNFPYKISVWGLLPINLDAAVNIGIYTYFFKAPLYYKYNDKTEAVEPNYPRKITEWLHCQ